MKKLNKKAALVFNTLIGKMNGEQHLKIDNTDGAFMSITIEKIQS
jgi:starvation-inducible outer membrane lipoprotein